MMPSADDRFVWLVWPVAAPLTGAVAAFWLGGRWAAPIGLAVAAVVTVAAGRITACVWQFGPQSDALGGWSAPLGIELHADGLTCAMLLMSACVGVAVSVYAAGYYGRGHGGGEAGRRRAQFWALWLILWSALHALFLSADVFNLYVTLELLTLAAVGMVVLSGTAEALEAAQRYLLAALAGSLLYLAGVAVLYGAFGALDVQVLAGRVSAVTPARAALLLMAIGLLLKTALFPFHFWLPPAHSSAPAPVSALLSGLVVKGSFYMLLRLWFGVFPPELTSGPGLVLAVLGAAAVLWGSLQALLAARLKLLVAYSTVAQLGYLFFVFALASREGTGFEAWSAVVLFAASHACAKAAMFLAAGTILRVGGDDRLASLAALSRRLPITFFAMGMASVALMGLPPSAAFTAKWSLLRAALAAGHLWLAVVIVLGGLLAAAYLFRVLASAFAPVRGAVPPAPIGSAAPVGGLLEYPALALALLSLVLGLAASPLLELLPVGGPWTLAPAPEAVP